MKDIEYMLTLREIRESKGIKQKDVAKYLGVTQNHYSDIENGRRGLTAERLMQLATFYKTSMELVLTAIAYEKVRLHQADNLLEYGLRTAMDKDKNFLKNYMKREKDSPKTGKTAER